MRTSSILVLACGALAWAQNGKWQQPGEIQQPKGAWQVPGEIQKPGAIQRVKEQCSTRLEIGSDALFPFNQADLTPQAETGLQQLGAMIVKEGKHNLTVEGYTDSIGTAAYNQELSEKRARAVANWLILHSLVAEAAVKVQGYGKNKPVAPNTKPDGSDNPEGRQKNRRVEVVINTCS